MSDEKMGELYSLERRRRGLDPRVHDLEVSPSDGDDGDWGVRIPQAMVGHHTPEKAIQIARKMMDAAQQARRMNRGSCRDCGTMGCDAIHPGQVLELVAPYVESDRAPRGSRWVVARRTKRAWRLERQDNRRIVVYARNSGSFKLVGWDGQKSPF